MMQLRLCLVALVALPLAGCLDGPNPNVINVVAIDRSGSTQAIRESQKRWLVEVFKDAQDRGQKLSVWAVDRRSVCLYGPLCPEEDRLAPGIFAKLDPGASRTATMTRPALFWKQMASYYAEASNPVQIVYCTDGGNDAPGDLPRLRAALKKLAANSNIRIVVLGVQPDQRAWLDAEFKQFRGRAQVLNFDGAEDALNQWLNHRA